MAASKAQAEYRAHNAMISLMIAGRHHWRLDCFEDDCDGEVYVWEDRTGWKVKFTTHGDLFRAVDTWS